jgi:hypothetical protein
MAIEDQMAQEPAAAPQGQTEAPPQSGPLSEDEEKDLKLGVLLAQRMIDDGGIEVIDKAVKESSDPGQVIGQFLMQLVSQLHEAMPEDEQLSKRIYFAHGGWIEQISDYLQEQYDVPRKIMDRAEMYIGSAAQSMAQGQVQQAAGGAPPAGPGPQPAQPPMPQPGAA